jgi:hypothetical protein
MSSVEGRKEGLLKLSWYLPLRKPKTHGTQAKPYACRLNAYEGEVTRPRYVQVIHAHAISEKKQYHQRRRREYACLSTAL